MLLIGRCIASIIVANQRNLPLCLSLQHLNQGFDMLRFDQQMRLSRLIIRNCTGEDVKPLGLKQTQQ